TRNRGTGRGVLLAVSAVLLGPEACYGFRSTGPAFWRAHAAQESYLYFGGGIYPRPWNRRDRGDLQSGERDAVAPVAGFASGAACGDVQPRDRASGGRLELSAISRASRKRNLPG